MSVDFIGDFLTIVRNGFLASKASVGAEYSNMRFAIAKILEDEGYIARVLTDEQDGRKKLKVILKYVRGESVIHEIKRMSTPGLRCYVGTGKIKPVISGLGISILTTSKGVVSNKQAKKLNVGGELICTVW
jgi:small subunit ribosomal protein S8